MYSFKLVPLFAIFFAISTPNYSITTFNIDTIPDLTEQTKAKDILKLPSGKMIEVDMVEEVGDEESSEDMETSRGSEFSCVTPIFAGKVRKFSKTVPHSGGRSKSFKSIADLLEWLPSDSSMKFHSPKIDRGENSPRVVEEQKNIILKKVFILAIYREEDNDFHVVLCDIPVYDGVAALFSAEVSGLPNADQVSSSTMNDLENVRETIINQLGDLNCGRTFMFKKGGLPVKVKGSLFFDIHHAGQVHGRQGLNPKSAWEIHPITKFEWLGE
jgi:hypothetical protein